MASQAESPPQQQQQQQQQQPTAIDPYSAMADESGSPGEDGGSPATQSTNLPPLTASEFREYNRLAEMMSYYHNHFKHSWNLLHNAATTGRRPGNMTLKQFLDMGLGFVRQLTVHHDIEESYLYPMLAPRMAEFRHSHAGAGKKLTKQQSELIQQHRDIHAGMDRFGEYLGKCRSREADLDLGVLREKMDSWGEVLWTHMDQEVVTLGAENMRKYWTVAEMRKLDM